MKQTIAIGLSLILSLSAASAQSLNQQNAKKLENKSRKLAKNAEIKTVCVVALAGSGSGAVISEDGHIVTNAHVGALSPYTVMVFADGKKYLAKRLGIDYQYDLAHYKIVNSNKKFAYYDIASESPKIGSWVAGIGYPGGPKSNSKPSFSLGVVQKPTTGPRMVNGVLDYSDAIVSDVPLFPGNSGGPMVDLTTGELLGINGAVNLAGGASFTIPIERVTARTRRLRGQVVLLPGNVAFSRTKYPFLQPIFSNFDNFVKQEMQKRMAPRVQRRMPMMQLGRNQSNKAPFMESDMLALRARKTKRNAQMVKSNKTAIAAARDLTYRVTDQNGSFLTYATRIDAQHVVAMTRKLQSRSVYYLENSANKRLGRATIAKSDNATGLSVLRASVNWSVPETADYRPNKQIGRMIFSYTPRSKKFSKSGRLAGVISCQERPINGARELARAMASDTTPKPVKQFLKLLVRVARTLQIDELEQLVKEIEKATKIRTNYMRGSRPRSFKRVFTHDMPLAPSEVGSAIVDRFGRLVGVNVANAHYGSSYGVSIHQINKIFGGKVRNKRAKLY